MPPNFCFNFAQAENLLRQLLLLLSEIGVLLHRALYWAYIIEIQYFWAGWGLWLIFVLDWFRNFEFNWLYRMYLIFLGWHRLRLVRLKSVLIHNLVLAGRVALLYLSLNDLIRLLFGYTGSIEKRYAPLRFQNLT